MLYVIRDLKTLNCYSEGHLKGTYVDIFLFVVLFTLWIFCQNEPVDLKQCERNNHVQKFVIPTYAVLEWS